MSAHAHGLRLPRQLHLGAPIAAELLVAALDARLLAPTALMLAFHREPPAVKSSNNGAIGRREVRGER
jgi:hypothetical protein